MQAYGAARGEVRWLPGAVARAIAPPLKPEDSPSLSTDLRALHEQSMQEAIKQACRNPRYPFGAVIRNSPTREILARGVNASSTLLMLHGEVVALNDYVAPYGQYGWTDITLHPTAAPGPWA